MIIADSLGPYVFSRREWIARVGFPLSVFPIVQLVGYDRLKQVLHWVLIRAYGRKLGTEFADAEGFPDMDSDEVVKILRAVATYHQSKLDLSTISAPTLILFGDHGLPFIQHHAAKLAAEIPDAVVESIPATTHMLNVENSEAFDAAIQTFIGDSIDAH